MTTALACHSHSMIYVPLYDTLGEPAIVHIINQSMLKKKVLRMIFHDFCYFLASLKTVFVDKPENVLVLLKLVKQVPTLKRIILTKKLSDDKDSEIRTKAKEINIEILTFNQLQVRIQTSISSPSILFSS
jgi:long-subunit acyl-CoA synthetase (AMP-forming)